MCHLTSLAVNVVNSWESKGKAGHCRPRHGPPEQCWLDELDGGWAVLSMPGSLPPRYMAPGPRHTLHLLVGANTTPG